MDAPPRLTLAIEHHGTQRAACRITGELDLTDADRVRDALVAALGRASLVAVDVSELGFLDSTGMRALHEASEAAAARGGRLVLVSPPPRIEALLAMVGIASLETSQDRTLLGGGDGPGGPAAG